MNIVKCHNCGSENKNTNIRCEFCDIELNHIKQNNIFCNKIFSKLIFKFIDSMKIKKKNMISEVFKSKFSMWLLVGLMFISVSLCFNIIENSKSKNYLETEGRFINYEKRQYYDEEGESYSYVAIYEYTVNGITYKGSPIMTSNGSKLKKIVTVKYNPDNPSEYVIPSNWNAMLIVGVVMVVIFVGMFIVVKIYQKKVFTFVEKNMKNR